MATPKKSTAVTSKELLLPPDEPSLLFATRELIRTNGIDFDKWWDEFKNGFAEGKRGKDTNFKVLDWTKPKMVNITPISSTSGAMTIEYWPDKSQLETSYLLSGTVSDLISGIMDIMRRTEAGSGSISGKGSKPLLKGFPCIKLLFKADDGTQGVKQIRCVGFTADNVIAQQSKNIQLITKNDVGKWSTRIKTLFGDTEYVWKKGIECLSYSGMVARLQGVEGYAYVKSEADGIALFKAMLDIFGNKPDMNGFNFSSKTNEAQFTAAATEVIILGEKVKTDKRRAIADCKFVSAALCIEGLKKPIPMVRGKVALNLSNVVISN